MLNCWTLHWICPSSFVMSHHRRVVRLTNALNKWQVLLYPVAKWQQKNPSAEWDHHHDHHPPQWRSCVSTNSLWVLVADVLTGKQHMNIVINLEEFLYSPHESLQLFFVSVVLGAETYWRLNFLTQPEFTMTLGLNCYALLFAETALGLDHMVHMKLHKFKQKPLHRMS